MMRAASQRRTASTYTPSSCVPGSRAARMSRTRSRAARGSECLGVGAALVEQRPGLHSLRAARYVRASGWSRLVSMQHYLGARGEVLERLARVC